MFLLSFENVFYLLAIEEGINNPLQALSALDHIANEASLKVSVLLWNVLDELLVTTSNSKDDVVSDEFSGNSLRTDQIQLTLNMKNWNGDVEGLN